MIQSLAQIGVIHYGLGPIGRAVAAITAERPWLRSVGAIDANDHIVGRALSDICGFEARESEPAVVRRVAETDNEAASIVLHCTGSSIQAVAPQLRECLELGLNVVSTCEELAFPLHDNTSTLLELDAVARRHNVRLLGTGINPGFAMDYLPMVLSSVAQRVDRIVVRRRQDASTRRVPLQRKVGAGLSAELFAERTIGHTIGHVGLRESANALSDAFGWIIDRFDEGIVPVLSHKRIATDVGNIEAGDVTGISQTLEGYVDDRQVLSLSLEMAVQLVDPTDEIWLFGEPDIHMTIPGGLHGDIGTASIVVNAIPVILEAKPGLRVMRDLPPMTPARPGSRRGRSGQLPSGANRV